MAGNHIRIFLSSPSDVEVERERLAELVVEINDVLAYLAPEHGLKLELIRYEIDAYPEYGRPQEVVNRQLPSDFEIFIGVMWRRCGTPTASQKSGTIEEYISAVERRKLTGKPVIMFYFCDKAVPFPTLEEIDQLKSVVEFKTEMQSNGLTQVYPSSDAFREYVRGDLLRAVRDLLEANRGPKLEALANTDAVTPVTPTEERTMRALCLEYDEVRQNMRAGGARTAMMSDIFSRMRSHAASVRASFDILKVGQSAGERLAAVAILQMFPMKQHLDWLAERLNPELEKPFFGLQAAHALLAAARSLPLSDCPALRQAVPKALKLARLNTHDPPRIIALESAVRILDEKCPCMNE